MLENYEAMFLVDPSTATKDNKVPEYISNILDKYKVKVKQETKWADRNLSYKIKGHRRGSYYLVYFEAQPENISKIREECELSPVILRTLILLAEPPAKPKTTSGPGKMAAVTSETNK